MMMNKKAGLLYLISIVIIITIVGFVVISEAIFDFKLGKQCKQENPEREFCQYVGAGLKCGYKCEELNMEFYYFDNGGLFANDKCVCQDDKGYPHTIY